MSTQNSKDSRNFLEVLPSQESKPRRSLGNLFGLKKTKSGSSSSPSDLPPPYQDHDPVTRSVRDDDFELDDPYAFLREFDTVFLIDDSGSMAGNRWIETLNAIRAITPTCIERDPDGIDVLFLNHPGEYHVTESSTVTEIFQTVRPNNGTPTGQRLADIFRTYEARYRADGNDWAGIRPQNVIVITDGAANDRRKENFLTNVIQNFAATLDRLEAPKRQIGVQFFQIGGDAEAKEMLDELDDNLKGRDIVDTVRYTGRRLNSDEILKVVGGAVQKRLDGQSIADIRRERLRFEAERRRGH